MNKSGIALIGAGGMLAWNRGKAFADSDPIRTLIAADRNFRNFKNIRPLNRLRSYASRRPLNIVASIFESTGSPWISGREALR